MKVHRCCLFISQHKKGDSHHLATCKTDVLANEVFSHFFEWRIYTCLEEYRICGNCH